MIRKEYIWEQYEEACKESDPFIRKMRLAFCLVLVEDKKLLEELAKQ